jgi:hypothetical protein
LEVEEEDTAPSKDENDGIVAVPFRSASAFSMFPAAAAKSPPTLTVEFAPNAMPFGFITHTLLLPLIMPSICDFPAVALTRLTNVVPAPLKFISCPEPILNFDQSRTAEADDDVNWANASVFWEMVAPVAWSSDALPPRTAVAANAGAEDIAAVKNATAHPTARQNLLCVRKLRTVNPIEFFLLMFMSNLPFLHQNWTWAPK